AARAATQGVTTSPANVSFGLAEWPHDNNQILTRTVTYQNSGGTDADLDLSVHAVDQKGATAPSGLFTISPTHLDVPAGGSAKVTVTANIGSEAVVPGEYSGQVEAADGTTAVSTPMGVVQEDERYSISLTHIGRDGAAPDSHVTYLDRIGDCLDLSTCLYVDAGAAGTTTWRVPPGDYDLAEYSTTAGQAGQTLMMQPVLHVATNMSVTLDARNAEPVHLSAPDTSVELFESDLAVLRDLGRTGEEVNFTLGGDGPDPLYSGSIGDSAPHAPDLVSGIHGVFAQPGTGDFTDSPVEYDVADFQSGKIHSGIELHPVTGEFAKLNTSVTATSSADHLVALSAGARPTDGPGATAPFTSNLLSRHVPFTRSRYLLASGMRWTSLVQQMVVGSPGSPCPDTCPDLAELDEPQAYAPAKIYEDPWFHGVWGPRFTQPGDLTPSGIEPHGAVRQGDHFAAGITMLADAEPAHMSDPRVGFQPLTLYRDGEVIASSKGAFITADLPADAATYRLDAAAVMPYFDISTRISSSWTFRSGHVQGTQSQPLPFMAIRYAPALDEHNHAPASTQFSVPVAVERQPGAAPADVTTLTVQVSYDDGATWSAVPLLNSGGNAVITIENRPESAVSLRATAKDSAGDSVTQTILRAYLVE
ncbi:hypothetical protein, partial [Streptomyces sp900116325]|uniref:hypothetical protein n=1 Tax=Streptomyces sp. 900116325 TaxID=3154295 RepID=UPI003403AD17